MSRTWIVASLLISTLVVAGCGDADDVTTASSSDRTTTTSDNVTTTASDDSAPLDEEAPVEDVTDEEDDLSLGTADIHQVPDDDGGKVCEVVASVTDRYPSDGETAGEVGRQLVETAAAFEAELLPIVPAQIAEDAEMFVTQMRDAGEELVDYPDPDAGATELIDDEDMVQLGVFAEMVTPGTDEGTGEDYYSNYFVAWSADPCGPKALVVVPNFTSIATEI